MTTQKNKHQKPGAVTPVQEFANRMAAWHGISDGSLSARIAGEFSAGKTRLLSAVLGDSVPPALVPVSSRDVQTRLPLEVTFGDAAALTVVEYPPQRDLGATTLRALPAFPAREEVMAMGLDPQRHRLRLALPLPQLVLPNGDFFDERKTPKRLFLIDMPGWNAVDDEIAEDVAGMQLAGDFNLALVYVVNASRIDSHSNLQRLAGFLEVLADAEFVDLYRMLLVITHCGDAERARLEQRAACQIVELWTNTMGRARERLDLAVLSADFDAMAPPDLETFRACFWRDLLAPLGLAPVAGHPWSERIRSWQSDWQPAPKVAASVAWLGQLRALLTMSRDDGRFLPGMSMPRLKGLEGDQLTQRLRQQWQQAWRRQGSEQPCVALAGELVDLGLDPAHPLGPWWAALWLPQLAVMMAAAQHFFDCADDALQAVTPHTHDLEAHLAQQLDAPYAAALAAVDGSFARLLDSLAATRDLAPDQLVATMLSLVSVQQSFEERCARQVRLLAEHGV